VSRAQASKLRAPSRHTFVVPEHGSISSSNFMGRHCGRNPRTVLDLNSHSHDIQRKFLNRLNWHSLRHTIAVEKESTIWCGEIEVDQRAPQGLDAAADVDDYRARRRVILSLVNE
jgi:hypothetical protein